MAYRIALPPETPTLGVSPTGEKPVTPVTTGNQAAKLEDIQASLTEDDKELAKQISQEAPLCWNCDGRMTRTTDIHGAEVFICVPCTRSSQDPPLPDAIRAWEVERVHDDATGALRAVKICSAVLETDLWLLVDPSFLPPDGGPIFFEGELAFLAKKSVEEMKEIVKVKCAFPRCRVVQ